MNEANSVAKKIKAIKIFDNNVLSGKECDVILSALRKQIPANTIIVEDCDEDESGKSYVMKIHCCPKCDNGYRFLVPAYCERCGQKLVKSKRM